MFFKKKPVKPDFSKIWADFCTAAKAQPIPDAFGNPGAFLGAPTTSALLNLGREDNALLPQIISHLSQLGEFDRLHGCFCAFLIGVYGESEISNEKTDQALMEFFLQNLSLCERWFITASKQLQIDPRELLESDDAEEKLGSVDFGTTVQIDPDAAKAWAGMGILSLAVMSRISSSRAARDFLRAQEGVFEATKSLGRFLDNVGFIPYILGMTESENILLISPRTKKGVELHVEQIDINNVLFTLLQFELYHKNLLEPLGAGKFEYDPLIEKIAKHEPVADEERPEHIQQAGCFSYYTWQALQADGSFDQMQPVWGEGNLQEVPLLDGRLIILIDRPAILRNWGQAFVCGMHSRLRPKAELSRMLEDAEVSEWLAKIHAANK